MDTVLIVQRNKAGVEHGDEPGHDKQRNHTHQLYDGRDVKELKTDSERVNNVGHNIGCLADPEPAPARPNDGLHLSVLAGLAGNDGGGFAKRPDIQHIQHRAADAHDDEQPPRIHMLGKDKPKRDAKIDQGKGKAGPAPVPGGTITHIRFAKMI